jgi:hypothetical protein
MPNPRVMESNVPGMEPPASNITYKDQARSLEELCNGGSQPSRGAEPPANITYKDQALSLQELQARRGAGGGRQKTRPSATNDDDIIMVMQATPVPIEDPIEDVPLPPPPAPFPPHYPQTLGTGNESAEPAIPGKRRWKWWMVGGVVLVVLTAGVGAGVALAAGGGGNEEGHSPTNAPTVPHPSKPLPSGSQRGIALKARRSVIDWGPWPFPPTPGSWPWELVN